MIPVVRLPAAAFSAVISLWLGVVTPAVAGYDEGAAAFIRGDYEIAWQEWRALGERGHQSAQYNLGVLYSIGLGVEQDDIEASKWFRRAADRGLPAAQMRLGTAYLEGKGVPEDLKEAYFWFTLAATHFSLGEQHEQAVAARESTGAGLTRAQITEVLEKAMSWQPLPQSVEESEKERLIAEPKSENTLKLEGGDSNGLSSDTAGPAVLQSQTPTETSEAGAKEMVAEGSSGGVTADTQSGQPQDGEAVEQETAAPGNGQAEEPETAVEDVTIELANATQTGSSEAQEAADTSVQAAQESFAAHLSSVRSRDGTKREWQNLQNLFPDLLDERTLAVRRIEIAEQGTFYRVMAGPIDDYEEAQDLCGQLKASDQYCVVRRLGKDPSQ